MRILVNFIYCGGIGGVHTFTNQIIEGFKKLGHDVLHVHISTNKARLQNSVEYKNLYGYDDIVGFQKEWMLKKYKEIIDNYDPDMVFFPFSGFNLNKYNDNWKKIYEISGKRCFVVFHTPHNISNWFKDVDKYIIALGAIQEKALIGINYSKNLSKLPVKIIDFPIIIEKPTLNLNLKEKYSISPHRFINWKNVDIQIKAVPELNHPMYFTNTGIEYHYLSGKKRKDKYKNDNGEWIWDIAMKSGKLKYLGFLNKSDLDNLFKKVMCCVDMSTGEYGMMLQRKYDKKYNNQQKLKQQSQQKGMLAKYLNIKQDEIKRKFYRSLNITLFTECCKYGVIPILRNWSKINLLEKWENDDGIDTAYWIDDNNIVKNLIKAVNDITDNFTDYEYIIKENIKKAKKYFDCKVIAEKIINHYNKNRGEKKYEWRNG